LGKILIQPNGRKIVEQSTGGSSQKYRSGILKETYALDERGVVVLVDSYTDEHYDLVLSANEDGTPKIERIYGNKLILYFCEDPPVDCSTIFLPVMYMCINCMYQQVMYMCINCLYHACHVYVYTLPVPSKSFICV
jgi:hypothetical protein